MNKYTRTTPASPKVSWTVGGWWWLQASLSERAPNIGGLTDVCHGVTPYSHGPAQPPSPRATFLYGLVIGSILTIGVVMAIRAALSGPTGAGAVAAIVAVLALVLSIVVLVLNGLGDRRL